MAGHEVKVRIRDCATLIIIITSLNCVYSGRIIFCVVLAHEMYDHIACCVCSLKRLFLYFLVSQSMGTP